MDFTGRPMNGYVFVGAEGTRKIDAIRKWVELASDFVAALPRKRRVSGNDTAVKRYNL
jgi:hypothetical protein